MASLAAILAMAKPVALEARAELRDTRGFISMTTMRPSPVDGKLDVGPTCLDADLADDRGGSIAHALIFSVRQGLGAEAAMCLAAVCTHPWGRNFRSSR